MRGAGYGVAVLGAVLVIFGLLNHYLIRIHMPHLSTIILIAGIVVAVVGLVLTFVVGRNASKA